jgi:hypothetical protein
VCKTTIWLHFRSLVAIAVAVIFIVLFAALVLFPIIAHLHPEEDLDSAEECGFSDDDMTPHICSNSHHPANVSSESSENEEVSSGNVKTKGGGIAQLVASNKSRYGATDTAVITATSSKTVNEESGKTARPAAFPNRFLGTSM